MNKGSSGLTRVLATRYLIAIHLALIYLISERLIARYVSFPTLDTAHVNDPTEKKTISTPAPEVTPAQVEATSEPAMGPDLGTSSDKLIIPVEGVPADQLVNTFASARGGGRVHDAIDITAPAGTPVLAAVDGEIVRFWDSVPGGTTIYQLSMDRKFIYYYAHLQRRADDIKIGDVVKQGRPIGYVGDTGNAGVGNYHLHFSIAKVVDPKRYWEGTYVDPFPYLKSGRTPEAQ
jgi:murein DD-endopeptidase MepM/ murein hydrolase activator NlpD